MGRLILAVLLIFLSFVTSAQTKNFIDQPYIEVNGMADTLIIPNEIYVSIVLSEKDSRDRLSIEELEQRMVNALKGLGVNIETDLMIADMVSHFEFYLLKSKDVLKTKLYLLKARDALTVGQVFIKLEELGISNLSIDRVDHSNLASIKNTMRTQAIANAKESALALVKPLNQNLGGAIHIVDAENPNQQLQRRLPGFALRGTAAFQKGDKSLPKIEFEKIRVAVTINAKFMLK